MTACLALLGQLRGVRCSFISTSSPSEPNNLRELALGAAAGAMEVTEEVQSAGGAELSPASSAGCGGHRAPWQPGPPLHPACSGEKEELRLGLGLRSSGTRAGLGHRHKHQGWGQQEHEKHGQDSQLVAHSSSCSLCGWHWVKAKQSQWVVSTVHYKPGQQAG